MLAVELGIKVNYGGRQTLTLRRMTGFRVDGALLKGFQKRLEAEGRSMATAIEGWIIEYMKGERAAAPQFAPLDEYERDAVRVTLEVLRCGGDAAALLYRTALFASRLQTLERAADESSRNKTHPEESRATDDGIGSLERLAKELESEAETARRPQESGGANGSGSTGRGDQAAARNTTAA